MLQCHGETYFLQTKMFSLSEPLDCKPGTLWALAGFSVPSLVLSWQDRGLISPKTYLGPHKQCLMQRLKQVLALKLGTQ